MEADKLLERFRKILISMGFKEDEKYKSSFYITDHYGVTIYLHLNTKDIYTGMGHFRASSIYIRGQNYYSREVQKRAGKTTAQAFVMRYKIENVPTTDEPIIEKIQKLMHDELRVAKIEKEVEEEKAHRKGMTAFYQGTVSPEWKDSVRVDTPTSLIVFCRNEKELGIVIERINNILREEK